MNPGTPGGLKVPMDNKNQDKKKSGSHCGLLELVVVLVSFVPLPRGSKVFLFSFDLLI